MSLRILYNFATRSRRSNFLRGVQSIIDNSESKDFHILVSIEQEIHDPSMHPLPSAKYPLEFYVNPCRPTSKIDAINRAIKETDYEWDVIINFSDDMVFTKKGFDNIIREQFESDLDLCLHFPDGSTGDKLMTMSIMGRVYYERFNYIYHPSYISLYCDNEATEVAKKLSKYKFVNQNIFLHLHPANGNAPNDLQYIHTESFHPIDRANYDLRKAMNFGLSDEL